MTAPDSYENLLRDGLDDARELANEAKSKQADPQPYVEIPVAEDMAERCEKILEREYGEKIQGLAEEIRVLENDDDEYSREEMSLILSEEFATGSLGAGFESDANRVEAAIRSSVALLTEGVVAAPIEGIGKVEIDTNDDGSEFLRVPYFGPIRSAGGTAQAVSVLVADYVRQFLDIGAYEPRDDEVERYVEEVKLYDDEVGMQYCPSKDESRFIVRNTPVMVDGQPNPNAVSREIEGYRDLERIEGNHVRDGMALVFAEGVGLKAPKLQRYADAFELSSWDWLDELVGSDADEEDGDGDGDEDKADESDEQQDWTIPTRSDEIADVPKKKKYMKDALAGRPIFSGPSHKGGFRLRYGRARNTGLAACGFSPATMQIVNRFIASGTQLATERPGKAAGAAPVDSIQGPTVKLASGELVRVDDVERAEELSGTVEKIVDLGEIAVPFGEFEENNHPLVPASYSIDWWQQDYEAATGDKHESGTVSGHEAIEIATDHNIPLHPEYTYLWHDITPQEYAAVSAALSGADDTDEGLLLDHSIESVLESLLVPHQTDELSETVTVTQQHADVLEHCVSAEPVDDDVLGQVNDSAPFAVRARAPTRIGARMGRPEKAEKREMQTTIHSLAPTGRAARRERSLLDAAKYTENADSSLSGEDEQDDQYRGKGVVRTGIAHMRCPSCETVTWRARCETCGTRTEEHAICRSCGNTGGDTDGRCQRCGTDNAVANRREFDIRDALSTALDEVNVREETLDKLKGVKGLSSKTQIPEPLEKGALRAKHDISVFRDGTARFDMSDLPLTSFRPAEVDISVEELHELGYTETLTGEPLETAEQLVELKLQDVIVSDSAAEYLLRVADYVDDLLVDYYDMEPHYDADSPDDLIGSLLMGMAPHTSAGVVGRLIGFSEASANYAHPFFHAAKRRNCFHPETVLTVKLNGEWNRLRIDELVETYLQPGHIGYDDTYDDETIVQSIEHHSDIDELKVPSMTDSGSRTIENITHLSKHEAPETMLTIHTVEGDTLTVTPDHQMPVKSERQDGLIQHKRANQIETGDLLFDYNEEKRDVVKNHTEGSHTLTFEDETATVESVTKEQSTIENTYNLTVENTHRLETNGLVSKQCDGDEDCVMLLMDGLLNFSRKYLPDQRGKNMMDAPIVMSAVIDPDEIDDEAHNIDVEPEYSRSFYEKTMHAPSPDAADITMAEDRLDDPTNFEHSLDTKRFHAGPTNTSYKQVDGMQDALNEQLDLAERSRAVSEKKVASLVIEKHFFPDIIGNLTAFARQETYCRGCDSKHRRVPMTGECPYCGNSIQLTVHKGMVDKYMETAQELAHKYELRPYTKQRLNLMSARIDSLFEDDMMEQSSIEDYI